MTTKFRLLIGFSVLAMSACNRMDTATKPETRSVSQDTVIKEKTEEPAPVPEKNEASTKAKKEILSEEVHPTMIPLTVIVDHLKSPDAPIEMSVYGPENKFPAKDDQLKKYRFTPANGKLVAKIKDLNYGEFALALYQDVDADGEIDKNGIGIPTEPYAFSNNVRPVIKAPSFNDCKFDYNATTNTLNIALLK